MKHPKTFAITPFQRKIGGFVVALATFVLLADLIRSANYSHWWLIGAGALAAEFGHIIWRLLAPYELSTPDR